MHMCTLMCVCVCVYSCVNEYMNVSFECKYMCVCLTMARGGMSNWVFDLKGRATFEIYIKYFIGKEIYLGNIKLPSFGGF
mgnify:CR=1 FL=1